MNLQVILVFFFVLFTILQIFGKNKRSFLQWEKQNKAKIKNILWTNTTLRQSIKITHAVNPIFIHIAMTYMIEQAFEL